MKLALLTILASILCLLPAAPLGAQSGVVRLEFPAELDKRPYEIVPLDKHGLLLFYAQPELLGEDDRKWHFISYDTNLLTRWETDVPVLDGARYQAAQMDNGALYLFFFDPGKSRPGRDNYQVSVLNLGSGIIDHYKGHMPEVEEIAGLLVMQEKVVIACHLEDEHAGAFILDLKHQTRKEFRTAFPDQNFIEDLQPDPFSDAFLMVVSNYVARKQNLLFLLKISMEGELIHGYPVQAVLQDKFLNSAKVFAHAPSEYMLIGTYSNVASRLPGNNDYYGVESAGFFSTRFEEGEQQFMNYYNLLELENLRPAVSARDYIKMSRRKGKDETEYSADYEMILHPLSRHGNLFVIMAEAFYPDFRTVSDISYDYWGRPITHTYTVFEGYRIFQGMLLGFDREGNLAWDNSIEMSNIKTSELSLRAGYLFDGKPTVLYFNDGNKITLRAFAGNAILEAASFTELETTHRGDKVVEVGDNYMKPWYEDNFLCFGYHTIRNNMMSESEKRTVFYINKIIFE